MGIAADFIIIVVTALVAALVAQRLKQPVLVGYIVAGIVVGPFTTWFTVSNIDDIRYLADLGVALLLFAIGLQFSLKDLKPVRNVALIGTTAQIGITIGLGSLLGRVFGFDWVTAVWFGAIIAPSGTLVVLKTLDARGLMGTLSSRVIVGILIVQDVLSIPLMLILPELNNLSTGLVSLGGAALRAVVFLAVMFLFGTRLIPFLLKIVVRWNSRELFILTITALGLGVGLITYAVGLSLAFGAFVTGLVLSESDYSYQALSDIIPLRDLFGMLFFVSVGMLFDPRTFIENIGLVLLTVAAVMVLKAVVLGGMVRLFGYGKIIPLAVGLTMFQLGEFSFVLAQVGLSLNAITPDIYALLLSTAILTTILTPLIAPLAAPLYRLQKRHFQHEALQTIHLPATGLSDHIIVAGGGRTGYYIARILQSMGLPFVVIEFDYHRLERLKAHGIPAIYGDASQEIVLQTAHLADSCLFLLTVTEVTTARETIQKVRRLTPDLHIIARAEDDEYFALLSEEGIFEIIQPEFEAGLEFIRQAMLHMDIPPHETRRFIDDMRHEVYTPLPGPYADIQRMLKLREVPAQLISISWVDLPDDHPPTPLSQLPLDGSTVVGILRNGEVLRHLPADAVITAEDVIGVLGDATQIEQARYALWHAS